MSKLQGPWAPKPTSLAKDRRVDKDSARTLVDFLIKGGIAWLFTWEHRARSLYLPAMELTCVPVSSVNEQPPSLSDEGLQFVKHYPGEAGFQPKRQR